MTMSPAFDLVLFGGTGDLVMRKLLPALYQAHAAGALHADGRILALGRHDYSRDDYLARVAADAKPHVQATFSEPLWQSFLARLDYLRLEARNTADFAPLAARVNHDPARSLVFYLATAPDLFSAICERLAGAGLNTPNARVVLEKPLGHDLHSSNAINDAVAQHFSEEQLYRIDHYLGKESVQNLLAIRFGNILFEPLWRREWVRDVQITIAETLGVEGRGEYYDHIGALRDMLQNHLLQLLCFVAMEPPAALTADAIRDEKLKVVKALRRFSPADVQNKVVRGQYRAGAIAGQPVPGYLDEPGINPHSCTETFVAMQAEIDNWRWAGVPFFLRTGKRLPERVAEIVVTFREVPHKLVDNPIGLAGTNQLVIRLQPDERIQLSVLAKKPGDELKLQPVSLNLDFHEFAPARQSDAYERLLLDVIRGRLALFMRRDELVEAWQWVEPILDAWVDCGVPPKPYTAGSWGPAAATALASRSGALWHEEH